MRNLNTSMVPATSAPQAAIAAAIREKLKLAQAKVRIAEQEVQASEGRFLDYFSAEDILRGLAAVYRTLGEIHGECFMCGERVREDNSCACCPGSREVA